MSIFISLRSLYIVISFIREEDRSGYARVRMCFDDCHVCIVYHCCTGRVQLILSCTQSRLRVHLVSEDHSNLVYLLYFALWRPPIPRSMILHFTHRLSLTRMNILHWSLKFTQTDHCENISYPENSLLLIFCLKVFVCLTDETHISDTSNM